LTQLETALTLPGKPALLDKPSLMSLNTDLATLVTNLLTYPATMETTVTALLTQTPTVEFPSPSESAPEHVPLDFGLMKLPTLPLLLLLLLSLDLPFFLTLLETVSTSPGETTTPEPSLTSSNTALDPATTRLLDYPATTEATATALTTSVKPTAATFPLTSEYALEDAPSDFGLILLTTLVSLLPELLPFKLTLLAAMLSSDGNRDLAPLETEVSTLKSSLATDGRDSPLVVALTPVTTKALATTTLASLPAVNSLDTALRA